MDRRNFMKTSALATGAFALSFNLGYSQNNQRDLYQISESLLRKWIKGLFDLQVKSGNHTAVCTMYRTRFLRAFIILLRMRKLSQMYFNIKNRFQRLPIQ